MISVQKLNKSYAQQQVLHTLNFAIAKGECYGLLGPNGAGKSTTVGILCGMTNPDSGEVTLGTYSLPKQAPDAKKIIGLVPQEIALYQELSPEDNLLFWGGLYQLSKREIQEQSDYWLKRFGLYEKRTQKIKTFSGGMKRRVNIASALMHRPSILFMDEPTVGVDPQSRNLIYEVIQELKNSGMTILYTTHYMEEAERFCDRIGIIDKGHLIAEGTLNELRQAHGLQQQIILKGHGITTLHVEQLKKQWPDCSQQGEDTLSIATNDPNGDLSRLVISCHQAGIEIQHLEIVPVNLEMIFLHLTGKQLRDE